MNKFTNINHIEALAKVARELHEASEFGDVPWERLTFEEQCDYLRQAECACARPMGEAVAPLNPNAGVKQAFPNGRWN